MTNNLIQYFPELEIKREPIPELLEDKNYHIKIIGLFVRAKKFTFDNKDQQEGLISRCAKPAKELTAYPPIRIIQTMKWLIDNADFKWTLESVLKYINEDLSQHKAGGKIKTEEDKLKEILNK